MAEPDSAPDIAALHQLAAMLQERGLATPALLLVDTLAPLSFLGAPLISALRVFIPADHWHYTATHAIMLLQEAQGRDLLHQLLEEHIADDQPARDQ